MANAQTPGYVRKTLVVAAPRRVTPAAAFASSPSTARSINICSGSFGSESAGGAYADLRSEFYSRLQQIYGDPSSSSSLETVFNNFTGSVQSLVTSPDSTAARSLVLSTAQVLAQTLNGVSADIQSLRGDAESGIADAVAAANDAMQQIAKLNTQLCRQGHRHRRRRGAGRPARRLHRSAFHADGHPRRHEQPESDQHLHQFRHPTGRSRRCDSCPSTRRARCRRRRSGTPIRPRATSAACTLVSPNGSTVDLIANNSIRSGKIAAYLDMRDNVLVQAQNQLDGLAATMAQALSDDTIDGAVATSGAQSGFSRRYRRDG